MADEQEKRKYFYPNPGRVDIHGFEWFLTDGSNDWHRYDRGSLIVSDEPPFPDPSRPWEHPGHLPVQHRDGKPPWCKKCGWTSPVSIPAIQVKEIDRG